MRWLSKDEQRAIALFSAGAVDLTKCVPGIRVANPITSGLLTRGLLAWTVEQIDGRVIHVPRPTTTCRLILAAVKGQSV